MRFDIQSVTPGMILTSKLAQHRPVKTTPIEKDFHQYPCIPMAGKSTISLERYELPKAQNRYGQFDPFARLCPIVIGIYFRSKKSHAESW